MALITIAESLKKIEKRMMQGTMPTKDDLARAPALNGEILFGFNEETRRNKLLAVYSEIKK